MRPIRPLQLQPRRSRIGRLLLAVSSVCACAYAQAQITLFALEDDQPGFTLGSSVAELEDVSGDGVQDFAVSGIADNLGIVRVFSGADGQALFTIESGDPGASFGEDRNVVRAYASNTTPISSRM